VNQNRRPGSRDSVEIPVIMDGVFNGQRRHYGGVRQWSRNAFVVGHRRGGWVSIDDQPSEGKRKDAESARASRSSRF